MSVVSYAAQCKQVLGTDTVSKALKNGNVDQAIGINNIKLGIAAKALGDDIRRILTADYRNAVKNLDVATKKEENARFQHSNAMAPLVGLEPNSKEYSKRFDKMTKAEDKLNAAKRAVTVAENIATRGGERLKAFEDSYYSQADSINSPGTLEQKKTNKLLFLFDALGGLKDNNVGLKLETEQKLFRRMEISLKLNPY